MGGIGLISHFIFSGGESDNIQLQHVSGITPRIKIFCLLLLPDNSAMVILNPSIVVHDSRKYISLSHANYQITGSITELNNLLHALGITDADKANQRLFVVNNPVEMIQESASQSPGVLLNRHLTLFKENAIQAAVRA